MIDLYQSFALTSIFRYYLQVIQFVTGPSYGPGITSALCLYFCVGVVPSVLLAIPTWSSLHGCGPNAFP
jgi:hypothetical protein